MMIIRLLRSLRDPSNAVWLLPALLLAAAALIVGVNTLALPAAAPALVWGIPRPEPVSFAALRGNYGDRRWRDQLNREVRREFEKVMAEEQRVSYDPLRGLSPSERLQVIKVMQSGQFVLMPPPGGEVRTAAVPAPPFGPGQTGQLAARPLEAAPAPPAPPSPPAATFITPLGLHKSGVEGAGLYMLSLISFGTVTALLAFVVPSRFRTARDALLAGSALRPLAVGVLAHLLAALLSLFLVMLVIGGPLASLILGMALLLSVAGLATAALALGRYLVRRVGQAAPAPVLELVTGVLAVYVAAALPFLGWPLVLAASCAGLGSLIMTRFGSGEPWTLRALE